MRRLVLVFLIVAAGVVRADGQDLPQDDLRRLLLTHQMGHTQRGRFFGAEFHFSDGTVVWRYGDNGECLHGAWWFDKGDVCYRYEGVETVNCLRYSWREGELFARDRPVPGRDGDESRVDLRDPTPPACASG